MSKGERIRKKREELNISQTDLAKRVGISKQTLYKYENDIITNIPSDVIERISDALNCSPAFIMGWDYIPPHILAYAKILSKMDKSKQENIMEYIDYIEQKNDKKEE